MSAQIEIYSQRDPRWAGVHLGLPTAAKTSTLGAYGCAVTAIAQKLTLLGTPMTPDAVQRKLLEFGAFRADATRNLIDWARVPVAFPHLEYNGRADYPDSPVPVRVLNKIGDRLGLNEPVVVYVDASRFAGGVQQHFVLVTGMLESGELVIANPWNGQVQSMRVYGKTAAVAVCGVIFLDWRFDVRRAI